MELTTSIFFIWNIQLVKNCGSYFSVLIKISFRKLFCLIPKLRLMCSSFEFRSYYRRSDDFEIEEPWKVWKLICKAPNSDESGTKCWLAGLAYLKTAAVLSIINYSLKDIPMSDLEVKYNIGWFCWIQS